MNNPKTIVSRDKKIFKNVFLSALIMCTMFTALNVNSVSAKTVTAKKTVKKSSLVKKTATVKKTTKAKSKAPKTTMKWDASGLRALGSLASFDYSYSIRDSFVKKVENYARRKHIKTITASVINNMTE